MSQEDIKVIDHPHLVRRRGAIVNKDTEGFQRFNSARKAIADRDRRLNALEARVEALTKLFEQGNAHEKK